MALRKSAGFSIVVACGITLLALAACEPAEEEKRAGEAAGNATAEDTVTEYVPSPAAPAPDVETPPTEATGNDEASASDVVNGPEAGCVAVASAHSQNWLGKPYEEAKDAIVETDDVKVIRVIRPGQPVTMDYNPWRLNVELDDADAIRNLTCG